MNETTTRRDVLINSLAVATGVVANAGSAARASTAGRFRVAVTGDFENMALKAADWSLLGSDAEVVSFSKPLRTAHETATALRDFDAVTLMHERVAMPKDVLDVLPRLKLIVFSGNAVSNLDDQAARRRNIVICKSAPTTAVTPADAGGSPPSELTLGLIMDCARRISAADAIMRRGGWTLPAGIALRGKVLGIVGYGDVGKPVGTYGRALGMRVLGFSRGLSDEAARADGVTRADLETLLRTSDVVSIHLPLTPQTRGMISARELGWMKPGSIFINAARAAIVDEAAVLQALRTRHIGMGGFDVFWQEPVPANHPLLHLDNVVLTPHVGYVTDDTMIVRYQGLLEVLAAYRQGNIKDRYVPKPRS